MGARPTKDGLSATAFPSGVSGVPVEATEAITPVVFWKKEFRESSGAPGCFRGGCGQIFEIGGLDGIPFDVLAMYERVYHAPRGREGGKDGSLGRGYLKNGKVLRPNGQQNIPANDSLVLELAGGAGFGNPLHRDPVKVAHDVKNGFVTKESAREDYGVSLDSDGKINQIETESLRSE